MSDPKDNMGKCWHEGKEIIHQDDGLVIHRMEQEGERSSGSSLRDEPNYPLREMDDTGILHDNLWRSK